jgi:hypothetical protein
VSLHGEPNDRIRGMSGTWPWVVQRLPFCCGCSVAIPVTRCGAWFVPYVSCSPLEPPPGLLLAWSSALAWPSTLAWPSALAWSAPCACVPVLLPFPAHWLSYHQRSCFAVGSVMKVGNGWGGHQQKGILATLTFILRVLKARNCYGIQVSRRSSYCHRGHASGGLYSDH